ncbi:phage holin family protein [Geodermatophilus sp. SYSU D00703]
MTAGIPGVPSGDLLQPLTGELSRLVHGEFQRLREEFLGPARRGRTGARMLGGSVVLGSMAAGGTTALLIRLLDRRLPPTASAAVVAAALGAGASALAAAGRAQMRQAWQPTAPGTAS